MRSFNIQPNRVTQKRTERMKERERPCLKN